LINYYIKILTLSKK